MSNILDQNNYVGEIPFHEAQTMNREAIAAGYEYFLYGVPVSQHIYNFFLALKAKRPILTPCFDRTSYVFSYIGSSGTHLTICDKIDIAFRDTPDVRIGQLRITSTKTRPVVYTVFSKLISNEKYRCGSTSYHTVGSTDIPRAVKLALKYLLPRTLDSIMGEHKFVVDNAITTITDQADSRYISTCRLPIASMALELIHMLTCGYKPATTELAERLATVENDWPEIRRLKNYSPRRCFVLLKNDSLVYRFTDQSTEQEITNIEDFPQDLMDKLSVLRIAKADDPIVDVGVRVSDSAFWLFV